MNTNGVKLYNERVTKEFLKYRKVCRIYCSNCDVEMKLGEMNYTTYATYPPIYEFVCPKCNHKMTSSVMYPVIEEVWENEDDMRIEVMD